jgi:hypothetical protein
MNPLLHLLRNIKAYLLNLARRSDYQSTYHESNYRRPIYQRLTPLSRFVVVLALVVLVAFLGVLANQSYASNGNGELLSDQLTAQPLPTLPLTPIVVIAEQVQTPVAPSVAPGEAVASAPTATPDYSRAPWAKQLFKQPDGTLTAPQKVIAQITQDLAAYYTLQRDLPIDDYLATRDTLLTTYFTGTALQEMQSVEQSRDLYAMNRAGRFSIEIRRFSSDGLTAKAGIITRDWVSDVYDVQSRQLIARGKIRKDILTIYTIAYNFPNGRWQFANIDEVTELTP